jgi:hypothetical protein
MDATMAGPTKSVHPITTIAASQRHDDGILRGPSRSVAEWARPAAGARAVAPANSHLDSERFSPF